MTPAAVSRIITLFLRTGLQTVDTLLDIVRDDNDGRRDRQRIEINLFRATYTINTHYAGTL